VRLDTFLYRAVPTTMQDEQRIVSGLDVRHVV
jgi:hypothetical protein